MKNLKGNKINEGTSYIFILIMIFLLFGEPDNWNKLNKIIDYKYQDIIKNEKNNQKK